MGARTLTFADRLIGEIDKAINVLWAEPRAGRPMPPAFEQNRSPTDPVDGEPPAQTALSEHSRIESARLMRVNHAGEVAAQALYRGQALTARDPAAAESMRRAAAE